MSAAGTAASSYESYAGNTAVVTGAGRGLGAGLARAAAAIGMTVVLADIDASAVERVAAELAEAGHRAVVVPTDVTDFASVDRLADIAFSQTEPVRLVANNAGLEHVARLWDGPSDAWRRLIDVNVNGVYHGIRAFVARLIDAAAPATILNTASLAALTYGPYQGAYQVSKHAVLAMSECLVNDLATIDAPIQVSVALPGPIDTGIFATANDSFADEASDEMRTMLRDMVAARGMNADDAGAMILERVVAGQRWISTHPKLLSRFADEHIAHTQENVHPAM